MSRGKRPEAKREPTLRERADTREDAFWAAKKAHEADPTAETAEALHKARAARRGYIPEADREAREREIIELLCKHPTGKAIDTFCDRYGLTTSRGFDWAAKAMASRRPSVVAYRDMTINRLEDTATRAIAAGDYNAAGKAFSQAAKFAGVAEKVEIEHHHEGTVSVEHKAFEDTTAPLAPHPKLFMAVSLLDRLPSSADVQRMLADPERYERAVDAALALFKKAVEAPETTALPLDVPTFLLPPPTTRKGACRQQIHTTAELQIDAIRREPTLSAASKEVQFERIRGEVRVALEALARQPDLRRERQPP